MIYTQLGHIGTIYNRGILWYFGRMTGKPTIEMGFDLLVIQPSYGLHFQVTLEQVEATGASSTSLDRYKYHQKASINGPFSISMSNNQRVCWDMKIYSILVYGISKMFLQQVTFRKIWSGKVTLIFFPPLGWGFPQPPWARYPASPKRPRNDEGRVERAAGK